jgi:hypothetical protein
MTLLGLVLTLIMIGVLLWLLNTYGAPYIDTKVLKIINAVVIIVVILWLLTVFGLLPFADMPVPRVR